jgi:hypothetical protein
VRCEGCQRLFNSLRIAQANWSGDGDRRKAPTVAEMRIVLANGTSAAQPPQPALRSAGHKRGQVTRKTTNKQIKKLRKRLRELEAAERIGSRGFVYLVAEEFPTAYPNRDGKPYIWQEAVKIGWAVDPYERIKGLQTGNPRKLVLLAMKPGTLDDERALHAKHINVNVLQEWFRPTMAVLSEFGLRAQVYGQAHLLIEGGIKHP